MSKEIQLTQGRIAIVDDEDYDNLNQYKWCVQQYKRNEKNTKIYAKKSFKGKQVTMHRFLLELYTGVAIDHINGNGLDNRRSNLRVCSKQGNAANRTKDRLKNATSKYKGVYKPKHLKKWVARIHVLGKGIHLGCFTKEEDAAEAYNIAAIKYFKEFACLNKLP